MMKPKFVLSHDFLSVHHEYFVGIFALQVHQLTTTLLNTVVSAPILNSSQTIHTHHQQVIRKIEQEILFDSTSRSVKTLKPTSARNFLNLLDNHFPSSNTLKKLFNRNSVKVSYSCMQKMKRFINKHSSRVLHKSKSNTEVTACNFRNKQI